MNQSRDVVWRTVQYTCRGDKRRDDEASIETAAGRLLLLVISIVISV